MKRYVVDDYLAKIRYREHIWPDRGTPFDTWDEAHAYICKRAADRVEEAKKSLGLAESRLKRALKMKQKAE